jgi:hypothetical protein
MTNLIIKAPNENMIDGHRLSSFSQNFMKVVSSPSDGSPCNWPKMDRKPNGSAFGPGNLLVPPGGDPDGSPSSNDDLMRRLSFASSKISNEHHALNA